METTTLDLTKILKPGDKVYSALSGKDVEITKTGRTIATDTGYIYYANGSYSEDGECMIFPSKYNRDWSTYKRELVEGEIYFDDETNSIFIHKKYKDCDFRATYLCALRLAYPRLDRCNGTTKHWVDSSADVVLANSEQRKIILDLIDKEGYVYNAETVELDKKPHEFKPFDKVLARDSVFEKWRANFFSHYNNNGNAVCISCAAVFVIPYEGNEHLIETADTPK